MTHVVRGAQWLLVSMAAAALSCTPAAAREAPPSGRGETTDARIHAATADATRTGESKSSSRCPRGMALVQGQKHAYCVDRWEATLVHRLSGGGEEPWPGNRKIDGREDEFAAVSVPGRKPQGYISGNQAERVCRNAHKRLCEVEEWVGACRGPESTRYPYGNERRANACNDRYQTLDEHPVVRLFNKYAPEGSDRNLMWYPEWMNDARLHEMSRSVSPGGAFEQCTNEFGVYDMVGNLHEWVADEDGTFLGGFFMDTFQNGEGCEYRTVAHSFAYHDYSTGFRCCAEALDSDAP